VFVFASTPCLEKVPVPQKGLFCIIYNSLSLSQTCIVESTERLFLRYRYFLSNSEKLLAYTGNFAKLCYSWIIGTSFGFLGRTKVSWAVARAFPLREEKAITSLEEIGLKSYLPICLLKMSASGRSINRKLALFPGYVFFKIEEQWREIFQLKNVNGLLMCGDKPSPIKDEIIYEIKNREDKDGFIVVDAPPQRKYFRKGQKVRVNKGAFFSFEGRFERIIGLELAKVRLEIFGRSTFVTMRAEELTAL